MDAWASLHRNWEFQVSHKPQPTTPGDTPLSKSANLIHVKWCCFVILICPALLTYLSQCTFYQCDSQLIFFFLVCPQLKVFPRPFYRASHRYHLVLLPCLLSSLMAIRGNQRQTNSFLQSLAHTVNGVMNMQVPEFQDEASVSRAFAAIAFVLLLNATSN